MNAERQPSRWRHALGLILLSVVVTLWTASSFLSSYMFASDTYSKPYLVTYLNTASFSLALAPVFARRLFAARSTLSRAVSSGQQRGRRNSDSTSALLGESSLESHERDAATCTPVSQRRIQHGEHSVADQLTVRETATLALRFCAFWFAANWFNAASFEYTTVASSTILVSSSSVFTLLLGAAVGIERFTAKKLAGVAACLGGVALISLLDSHRQASAPGRGTFPYKSPNEMAFGDVLALSSAIIYGFYATMLLKVVRDESRVNMPLFFGFVGTAALVLFWPGLLILDATKLEVLEPPPSRRIWAALWVNAAISVLSDMAWAYAVLLTSPLVVTVGLSLTIPLSLIGQMVIHGQYASPWHWLGGGILVLSFIFINYESKPVGPLRPSDD